MINQWYALHVRPRSENYVRNQLEGKGYEVFFPTYTTTRRWSDRIKSVSFPLFPSYLFCRFNVHDRLPVLLTPGVNFVVGVGKVPVAVDEAELVALGQLMKSGAATTPCAYLNVGETVQIDSGPLQGLRGIITRRKNSSRLVVSVSLLMRSVSVELDSQWMKPEMRPVRTFIPVRARESVLVG